MFNNDHCCYVVDGDKIIGQIFYGNTIIDNKYNLKLIKQLVVDKDYCKQRVGTNLVKEILGANDLEIGVYTSSPITIKIMESATNTKISLDKMKEYTRLIQTIKELSNEDITGIINTYFYTNRTYPEKIVSNVYNDSFPLSVD